MTVEDSRILLLLADGRGHTMTEVAEFALVPAPSVTRIVDRMVTHGLVHRTADRSDRRRVLVHLTPRGQALKRRLDEICSASSTPCWPVPSRPRPNACSGSSAASPIA